MKFLILFIVALLISSIGFKEHPNCFCDVVKYKWLLG